MVLLYCLESEIAMRVKFWNGGTSGFSGVPRINLGSFRIEYRKNGSHIEEAARCCPVTQDVYRLLGELQTIDFFLTEINMYLDSHPQDATALERQQRYQQIRQELDREYQGSIRLLHAAQQQLAAKK